MRSEPKLGGFWKIIEFSPAIGWARRGIMTLARLLFAELKGQ